MFFENLPILNPLFLVGSIFCTTFAPKIENNRSRRDKKIKNTMKDKSQIQLIIAALLALSGVALLFVGALLAPQGQIHESILVAFGEIGTFAGSIIGIDYKYKNRYDNTTTQNGTQG